MPLPPGTCLGPYEILAPLGAGGMGEVYRARDTRLGREVAIKVLPPEMTSDEERRQRFAREARAASALSHPNVATIYEYGDADGRAFIAMELVEGQPLSARIAGQPLGTREVVDLALQVADALEEAHGRGITHRDVKPANLMVTPRGRVKVLDFGLARLAPRELAAEASTELATQTGTTLGTVPYMSPEQAMARDVDGRSDLFSLGAVIYEMATGRRAFGGDNAAATTDQILHSQPTAMVRLNYDVPEELERIVRKCLEKDRARRYQSARDLVVDLANLKRDLESGSSDAIRRTPSAGARPAETSPPSPPGLAKRTAWRRTALGVAALALLALAAGFAAYQLWPRGSGGQKLLSSIVVLPLKNLSGNPDQEWFSDGMTESLIGELSKIKGLSKVIASTSAMQLKGTTKSLPELARELAVDVVLEGSAMLVGGNVRVTAHLIEPATARIIWTHEYDREMKDVLSLQREVARTVAGEIRVALSPAEQVGLSDARPVDPKVQEALLKGRYFNSLVTRDTENLRKALALFEEAARLDPRSAEAYAEIGKSYGLLGNWGVMPQAEAFAKSRDAALKALELDDESAEAHKAICFWHFTWQHDWPLAEREMKRALELAPNDAQANSFYANWLATMGRYDDAFRFGERARELAPLNIPTHIMLGHFYRWGRRYNDSDRVFKAILDLDPNASIAFTAISDNCIIQKKFDEAWQWRVKADRVAPGATDEYRRRIADAYRQGGWPAVWRLDIDGIEQSPLSLAEKSGGKSQIYTFLGEKDRAFAELEVAFREHSEWMWGLNDPIFDSIRSDPRFKDLRRRVNLPEE